MNLLKVDGGRFIRLLDVRKFINVKILAIVLIVVGVLGLFGFATYASVSKSITISDNGVVTQVKTAKKSVKDILNQQEIKIANEDSISPELGDTVKNGETITIRRATPMVLVVGGVEKNILTNRTTVSEVLQDQQIALGENDKLNFEPTQQILKDMILRVIKVREEKITEKESIAYKVNERQSTQISRGTKRTVKEGVAGQKQIVYNVRYEDNNVVAKEVVSQKIISKPVNAVVEVGVEPKVISRGAENLRYSKVINMQASAYTAGFESTGKRPGDRGYGRTATGITAKRGVVAVDPSVIPLGTKLYIESTDGFPTYGYAVAADKGSAIKGNKIDLFYESLSDAKLFGRRTVKVYVLE